MTLDQQPQATDIPAFDQGPNVEYQTLNDAQHYVVMQTRHDIAESEGIFAEADQLRKMIGDLKFNAVSGQGDGSLVIDPNTHEIVSELPPHPEGPWAVAPVERIAPTVHDALNALSAPQVGLDADLGEVAMRIADRGTTALLVAMYSTGNLRELIDGADHDSLEFWLSSVLRNVRRLTSPVF